MKFITFITAITAIMIITMSLMTVSSANSCEDLYFKKLPQGVIEIINHYFPDDLNNIDETKSRLVTAFQITISSIQLGKYPPRKYLDMIDELSLFLSPILIIDIDLDTGLYKPEYLFKLYKYIVAS